jgi:hypothetical protein
MCIWRVDLIDIWFMSANVTCTYFPDRMSHFIDRMSHFPDDRHAIRKPPRRPPAAPPMNIDHEPCRRHFVNPLRMP